MCSVEPVIVFGLMSISITNVGILASLIAIIVVILKNSSVVTTT